jgi:hypothetical protein
MHNCVVVHVTKKRRASILKRCQDYDRHRGLRIVGQSAQRKKKGCKYRTNQIGMRTNVRARVSDETAMTKSWAQRIKEASRTPINSRAQRADGASTKAVMDESKERAPGMRERSQKSAQSAMRRLMYQAGSSMRARRCHLSWCVHVPCSSRLYSFVSSDKTMENNTHTHTHRERR